MFWFRKSYDIRVLCASNDAAAMRAALREHPLDKRQGLEPWRIPLDYAAAAGNAILAKVLLELGSPLAGSSIYEAILVDSVAVLRALHTHDPRFFDGFTRDKALQQNPRLHRWTLNFTALDLARSINAVECTAFLQALGAPGKAETRKCRRACVGVFIADDEFIFSGGRNIDGSAIRTSGYYCAKCNAFQNW